MPFAKKRQRHGQNHSEAGVPDRAFYKKASKARSKPEQRGRPRPCLLQKSGKGTVKIGAKRSSPTVPFAKKRQRHGQNRSEAAVPDRAFYKKVAKARSKSEQRGRPRPCLLEKNVKGTVETGAKRSSPTVPFIKKRQRHGQNHSEAGVPDRAFCKKTSKARSKPEQRGRARPCLLQKSGKGTVKIGAKRSCPTVPFAKNEQKHGRNHSKAVVPDRAFCKKAAKARSKSQRSRRSRPCLLQKSGKGTVKTVRQTAQPTVPFTKKRQRHGQNHSEAGVPDRAFCKKTSKARSKLRARGRTRLRMQPPTTTHAKKHSTQTRSGSHGFYITLTKRLSLF